MKSALIGYTGFVGGNILAHTSFTDLYNSKNISEIMGKSYDLVVCAGVKSVMWEANKEPEKDWQQIEIFEQHLSLVKAKRCVLLSTVDVYPSPIDVTEEMKIMPENNPKPYGKHRLQLENDLAKLFTNLTIVRLPALFGLGIKKNFVYDLIHNKMLDYTHPDSQFQFYNLRNIWSDILFALYHQISLMNLTSEPLSAQEVAMEAVGLSLVPADTTKIFKYDMRSKYAQLRGLSRGYLYPRSQIMPELIDFIRQQKSLLHH